MRVVLGCDVMISPALLHGGDRWWITMAKSGLQNGGNS